MNMTPSRLSMTFLGSFLATTFVLQWWQLPSYPSAVWIILGTLFVLSLAGCVHPNYHQQAPWLVVAVLGTAISFFIVARMTHVPTAQTVDWYARDAFVTVRGSIAEDPDKRPLVIKYTVAAEAIRQTETGAWIPVEGLVLVSDGKRWPVFMYGDEVTVRGRLSRPEAIEDFAYDNYLSRYGIYSVMSSASITHTGGNRGSRYLKFLYSVKGKFEDRIEALLPEPHAAFAEGLLTGSRRGIPAHLTQNFTTTGLTHIIAISGYNITIVITVIMGFLFWLPFRWRFIPAMIAITSFTLFTGASASVVRAAIMGILGLLALTLGRKSDMRLAILWTFFVMLLWNCKQLWYDASFQLSFAAIIGLTELSPILKPWFERIPETLGLRESLLATMSAQITTIPLALCLFGNLSLIAPVANLLVAPFIPIAMLFGALGVGTSLLSHWLAAVLMLPAWMCLQWIMFVASFLAKIPGSALHFEHVSFWFALAYYLALLFMVFMVRNIVIFRPVVQNIIARRQPLDRLEIAWSATAKGKGGFVGGTP
ncbi:MAG: ComEC/Rec2 family competence protein [Candidatus Peribacteraceae bacterium]|nr:ComEC/Rec2 family competence protein [Candidatus Peribacteraceae bacterium]